MEENIDVFKKAWLFLYAAAGENIGFEIRPAAHPEGAEDQQNQTA